MPRKYIEGIIDIGSLHLHILPDFLDGIEIRDGRTKTRDTRGHFWCHNNMLTTLRHAPSSVGGDFYCTFNKLKSLVGAPPHIVGEFNCSQNRLESLEGCPQSVGGDFVCQEQVDTEGYSTLNVTEEDIRAVCDVKGKVLL